MKQGHNGRKTLYRGFVVRLDGWCAKLYETIGKSLVGRAMTAYTQEGAYLMHRKVTAGSGGGNAQGIRRRMSGILENSGTTRTLVRLANLFADCPLNIYGVFFLMYGLISTLMYVVQQLVGNRLDTEIGTTLTAGIIAVSAVPLLFSSDPLRVHVRSSRIGRFIMGEDHAAPAEQGSGRFNTVFGIYMALLFGVSMGLLSGFFNPVLVPVGAMIIMLLFVLFLYPETGVVLAAAAAPILWIWDSHALVLQILLLLTWLSYLHKLLEGRRTVHLGLAGVIVLLFGCNYLLCGIGSDPVGGSVHDAVSGAIMISGYFLATNLMTTGRWADRCVKLFCTSVTVVGVLALLVRLWGQVAVAWCTQMGAETFLAILTPLCRTLGADGGLYLFVLPVLPLLLLYLTCARSIHTGAMYALLLLFLCAVIADGGMGWLWISLLIGMVLYLLCRSHHTLTVLLLLLLPLVCIALLLQLPAFAQFPPVALIRSELESLHKVAENSAAMAPFFRMLSDHPFGVGVGDGLVDVALAAYGGTHVPNSFWLRLWAQTGIQGLLLFALFSFLFLQRVLEYRKIAFDRNRRDKAVAICFGILLLLLLGTHVPIFENNYNLFVFWTLAGMTNACIRAGRDNEFRSLSDEDATVTSADITVSVS